MPPRRRLDRGSVKGNFDVGGTVNSHRESGGARMTRGIKDKNWRTEDANGEERDGKMGNRLSVLFRISHLFFCHGSSNRRLVEDVSDGASRESDS